MNEKVLKVRVIST